MPIMLPPVRSLRIAASALASLLVLCGARAPSTPLVDERIGRLAGEAGSQPPIIRIGLVSAHRVTIASGKPYRVLDPATGRPVWKAVHRGELTAVAEGGPELPEVLFRVQAGSFATLEKAEAERTRIAGVVGEPVDIHKDPDRGVWRVRAGKAAERDVLAPLLDALRDAGVESPWIVEEPVEHTGVTLRLVDPSWRDLPTPLRRVVAVPEPGGTLEVEGKPYRGVIELRVSPYGTVRAVNWLGMEAYLLGVVPGELGPEVWPQLEALKAQAVAARTYAVNHLGQFEDEGYDLCATPRCQVYDGRSIEHPMSDRAVEETAGEILTWEGHPIQAFYTATCGGHTEDAREVFPDQDAPYLRGVPCRAEAEAASSLRATLRGRATPAVIDEAGEVLTRDWALLGVAGVIGTPDEDAGAAIPAPELREWTIALAKLSGRPAPGGPVPGVSTLAEAALALVQETGWGERPSVLLGDGDAAAILRDKDAQALPEPQRRALAWLVFSDALRPVPARGYGVSGPPSRARIAQALARIGDSYDAFALDDAVVAGPAPGGGLRLSRGMTALTLEVSGSPVLFGQAGGRPAAVSELDLWPGDRVRYRTDAAGRIDFLELRPPVKGTADDRLAQVYSWEVRRSRHELEDALGKRLRTGSLKDLRVVRRGVSGRIAELKVIGDRGSSTVRGFDVRTLLDLKESLAVIEIQRAPSGAIDSVVFAGKGWGHGVGLCQTGAYGMALRGESYRSILAHYYTGAKLEKADAGAVTKP